MSVNAKSQRIPVGTAPAPSLSVVKKTEPQASRKIDMRYLVRALIKYGASDLHLRANRPPLYRINGKLIPAKMEVLSAEQVQEIVSGVLSPRQSEELERKLRAAGGAVRRVEFPGGHGIAPELFPVMREFLQVGWGGSAEAG